MKGILTRIIIILLLIAGIVVMVRMIKITNRVEVNNDERIDPTPTRVTSIEQIGQWEFLSVSDEELVDTVDRGFLRDKELARIYYGTMRLGIDTQSAEPGWITIEDNDAVVVNLPPIQLLDKQFIDEARTRSFFESGSWKPADREAMYKKAYRKMLQRGMSAENIAIAEDNAKEQLTQLLRSMGYNDITINTQHARDSKRDK